MIVKTTVSLICLAGLMAACAKTPEPHVGTDMAIAWVKDSVEYQAVSRQAYRAATLALPQMIADIGWSALPDQENAGNLPAAIILDVDETSLTNPVFQASFATTFSDRKLDDWSIEHDATPVPGAGEFLQLASESGVQVFFVTNRACIRKEGIDDPCPQKKSVVDDLSDFIPCTRSRPAGDCTEAASAASRQALMQRYNAYWGAGWYILPNPMHGSGTSFR